MRAKQVVVIGTSAGGIEALRELVMDREPIEVKP
jgi:chemotaxis response regulator CheB